MAFKRAGSPFYQIRRRHLPGYGDTGQITSGVRSKKAAERMEALLETLAERALLDDSWRTLLDAVCRKELRLPDLLAAQTRGRLEALLRTLHDPLLSEAIRQFEQAADVERLAQVGLSQLRGYMPPGARLSAIADAKAITQLCRRAEQEGRKRNSVRRGLLRSISLLLRYHYGVAERNRVFADVRFAGEDDTREVLLRPEEIERLLSACQVLGYRELGVVIRMALHTGADRGVLVSGKRAGARTEAPGLRVRQLRIYHDDSSGDGSPGGCSSDGGSSGGGLSGGGLYHGEVYFDDRKAKGRRRTVPITDVLCRELLALCQDKAPDEQVFSLRYSQVDRRWQRVRERAGLSHVRFKDLRSQVAIYGERAGVPLTVLKAVMGHSDETMTQRYQRHQAVLSVAQMQAIEREMFGTPVRAAG